MKELTQKQIKKYNREIAFFLGLQETSGYTLHPDGSEDRYYTFPEKTDELIDCYFLFRESQFDYYLKFNTNWQWLMTAYCKLCEVLPFNFIDIQRDKVYANGYVDLPLQQAIFLVVGETCEKYNKREFPIKYKNEDNIKTDS